MNVALLYLLFFLFFELSLFQIYVLKISSSYFSVDIFIALIMFGLVIYKKILEKNFFLFLILLFLLGILSLVWAKDIKIGLKFLLILYMFMFSSIYSFVITKRNLKFMLFCFKIFSFVLSIEIFLVIIFRFSPAIELTFLHSNLAKIFINPNIVNGLFEGFRNNVFDPNKAGGFFVNANVAAAYLGINCIIFFSLYKAYLKKIFLFISILSIIGIICTGSKAGILLLILVSFLIINIWNYMKGKIWLNFNLYLISFLLIEVIIYFLLNKHNSIANQYINTTDIRLTLWKFGIENIGKHPFTGFGFGGWEKAIANYAFQNNIPVLPPHNTLIALWANMGILSVIISIFFIFSIIKYSLNIIKTRIIELVWLGIGLLNVFLWIFIHGMGTNFGIVGEVHMTILSGVFLGFVMARYEFYKGLIKYEKNHNI